ncbi:MAG: hypothetical protein ACYCO0_02305 [Candidatus Micrarchaeaceae archaeon]
MASNQRIQSAAEALWKEQNERNWKSMADALKKSGARYYRVVFANEGKLNKMQDLTRSFANLYDAKYRLIAKVPIFMRDKARVRGATIYLSGLQVLNKTD